MKLWGSRASSLPQCRMSPAISSFFFIMATQLFVARGWDPGQSGIT